MEIAKRHPDLDLPKTFLSAHFVVCGQSKREGRVAIKVPQMERPGNHEFLRGSKFGCRFSREWRWTRPGQSAFSAARIGSANKSDFENSAARQPNENPVRPPSSAVHEWDARQ